MKREIIFDENVIRLFWVEHNLISFVCLFLVKERKSTIFSNILCYFLCLTISLSLFLKSSCNIYFLFVSYLMNLWTFIPLKLPYILGKHKFLFKMKEKPIEPEITIEDYNSVNSLVREWEWKERRKRPEREINKKRS